MSYQQNSSRLRRLPDFFGITDSSGLIPLSRIWDNGIINNGPKEQPETKPKAPDLSALFEAARQVVQEDKQVSEPGKKPSVLAMLHAPAPSRSEKTAQTKSAERDLI